MRRRQVLGGLGVAAGGLVAASTRVRVGPLSTWGPDDGTWPLARYDLANTARNPSASPPESPTIAWRSQPLGGVTEMVVDRERVYAGSSFGDPMTVNALDREGGRLQWRRKVPVRALALREDYLYVAGIDRVRALDAETGETRWETPIPDVTRPALLVADGRLFVSGRTVVSSLDAQTGDRRWEREAGHGALADGTLVSVEQAKGTIRRFGPRRVSDVLTGGPPPVDWDTETGGAGPPVVTDDLVLVGTDYHEAPGLTAVASDTGTVEWVFEIDHDGGHATFGSPAVAGDLVVADRNYYESGTMNLQDLVAVSLADGRLRWQRDVEPEILTVAVGGDTVLATTGTFADEGRNERVSTGGDVRAVSIDGALRWTISAEAAVYAVAAVDETVFVGTGDVEGPAPGRVLALR